MTYSKLFSNKIPARVIVEHIEKAITVIYALPTEEYNYSVFHDIALGFKSIVHKMENGSQSAFPLFMKWLKLYVKIQHKISTGNEKLTNKFENKFPVCTSYILASLQYKTKIANYHLQVLDMCLSLFNATSAETMKNFVKMDFDLITLVWTPIEFVGNYNTQKMSLRLIVKILQYLNDSEKREKIAEIETPDCIKSALLKLSMDENNFETISRKLLNTYNMHISLNRGVFSVYCRTALFGSFELHKPKKIDKFWIDFNYTSKSISCLCQLEQTNNHPEEMNIQIKIDDLRIHNRCDCTVISTEPAIFSTEVSAELRNARVAVFTLPQNELERLKANRDLLDFYNRSTYSTYSYTESDIPPTPSVNEECSPMNVSYTEANEINLTNQRLPRVLLTRLTLDSITEEKSKARDQQKEHFNLEKGAFSKTKSNTAVSSAKQILKNPKRQKKTSFQQSQPDNTQGFRESGYNTAASIIKQDSILFKKPSKPAKPSQEPTNNIKQQPTSTVQSVQSSQSTQSSRDTSRRFFKAGNTSATPALTKTKRAYRKKVSITSSPKRKQVNTNTPLNHLAKEDFDPEQANKEYVENGGYFNISHYLQNDADASCFSETQKQTILKNSKMISDNIEQATRRSFHKQAATSDSDGNLLERKRNSRKRRKLSTRAVERTQFVPYSAWKNKLKEKQTINSAVAREKQKSTKNEVPPPNDSSCRVSSRPSTNPESALSSFDQLKICEQIDEPSTSHKKVVSRIRRPTTNSSVSSSSNHNFHVVDSDDEMIAASSDVEATLVDMICRRESIPDPISIDSPKLPAYTSSKNITVRNDCDSQVSEIYEDFNEVPPLASATKALSDPESLLQCLSIHSSRSSENAETNCTQNTRHTSLTTIPRDVQTQSEQNHEPVDTWYVERFLTELRPPTPIGPPSEINQERNSLELNYEQNCTNSQQEKVTIIQNQIILSGVRKRMIPEQHDDYPLVKRPLNDNPVTLRGYPQLISKYMEMVTKEKDRRLKQLELDQEGFLDNIDQAVETILKSITELEKDMQELQEELSTTFGKLEWLISEQQKNKHNLETTYHRLKGIISTYLSEVKDYGLSYDSIEDKLKTFADTVAADLWQKFSAGIVSSVEDRLKRLVNF